jgi:small-conductance mechanosensitive channel
VQDVQLTLGNVLLAGTLLLLTNRLARILSKLILKKVVEPFNPDSQALNTYRRMIYTANFVLFFVISLSIAGIPLTVFTVVGGALAIGIGFGSQNIVNNFISGLILMAERPLKVGDVVEVDSITGTVLEIGTRATRIRTLENKIWIVPNSMFLEKAVLNWSNHTAIIRAEVDVGVAYGSDLERVRTLALKVLQDMPFIEKSPQARVIFNDFGDNSLMFKLLFWADLEKVDSLMQCRSDIRFALEKVYREAGIEISYPQRDLHLRSSTPLEVRIQH